MNDSTITMWLKEDLADISPAEIALLESILPEIIHAMMQAAETAETD